MWHKPEFTKKQINDAGKKIIEENIPVEEKKKYLEVVDNWRACHAFPTNTFAIRLKRKTSDIKNAVVVQRLKRLDTIVYKLRRFPDMKLYRMQDLGGCRVIVRTVEDVYKVVKKMKSARTKHKLHNCKDYIAIPNPQTGYRGYHMIYRYYSDKKTSYNGLQVEIQIRTRLQHIWATAVETVGLFTDNKLKFSKGSEDWLNFFRLTSALFSLEEKTAVVENVPYDEERIYNEWGALVDKLNVIGTLGTIGITTRQLGHIRKSKKNQKGYYLIKLNLKGKIEVQVEEFIGVEKAFEKATEAYNKFENEKSDDDIDGVLVSAQSYESLVDAYPNYFLDVSEFLREIRSLLKKYEDLFLY